MNNVPLPYLLLKIVLILFVMVGVMFALAWLVKKYQSRLLLFSKGKKIQILEKAMLSTKHFLFLVEVENKTFLIGISPQDIKVLKELEGKPKNNHEEA